MYDQKKQGSFWFAVFSSFPYTSYPIYDEGKYHDAIATKVPAVSPVSVPNSSGTIPIAVISLVTLGVMEKSIKSADVAHLSYPVGAEEYFLNRLGVTSIVSVLPVFLSYLCKTLTS